MGAAEGFRERALREIVEPVSAALVPLIRNWMPADAGRTLLDEALAEARRRVCLEHHLLALARIDLDHRHPAMAEPHMRGLDLGRHASQHHVLMAPVELASLARVEAQRHIGLCRRH